ncbi:MAG: NfeD family protein, partial [Planctomycetota bacterium]
METMWSEEMVRWLTSPIVVSILVLGIMLGIYVEFNSPGLGLPALLAVTCLVILVGSRYLIGMANWIEVALLCIGFLLLMVEIFVIPGFGV